MKTFILGLAIAGVCRVVAEHYHANFPWFVWFGIGCLCALAADGILNWFSNE